MKYNRIEIEKLLKDYDKVLPDDLRGAAYLLKSRGRKCIFIEQDRMQKIIMAQKDFDGIIENSGIDKNKKRNERNTTKG